MISIPSPEDGVPYLLAAHYYNADALGSSATTVSFKVYLAGELVHETSGMLRGQDDWWEVAMIRWPEGEVEAIDRFFDSPPRQP